MLGFKNYSLKLKKRKNMNDKLITLPWKLERTAPPFEGNDIKTPEGLYRHIYKSFTKKGDKIFDPFIGLGTTMFVAEEMGRIPFGIEAETQKFEWVAGQLENWMHIINDDSFKSDKYTLPKMDLIITSPPFMEAHTKWNPLYGGMINTLNVWRQFLKSSARF